MRMSLVLQGCGLDVDGKVALAIVNAADVQ